MTELRDEYDSPWKDILESYFEDFMAFFFPEIHAEIDWTRGYVFLDQELSQITRDAETGEKIVDKLVKVWKLTGEETWVLLNVEIQSQEESVLGERVFTYFYRLKDKFNLPIASLVILGDDRNNWRPSTFSQSLWGCDVLFRFPTVKLLDYESQWADLEASRNPFAIVTMAHLKTKSTRKDLQSRKDWKFRLTRMLYENGYERQAILDLFRFIDWILELPSDLKEAFRNELAQYEQEKQMPYVTSIERMGIEQGRKEGRKEGERSLILRQLTRRVGVLPEHLTDRIQDLSIEQLETLAEDLLDFQGLDDLTAWFEAIEISD